MAEKNINPLEDVWVHYLTTLLGPAPNVLTLSILLICVNTFFRKDDKNGLTTSLFAPPITWVLSNFSLGLCESLC